MTTGTAGGELHKRDLAGAADRHMQASGVFHIDGAVCDVTFSNDDRQHSWMTRGTAGRDDVKLAHDTGNPADTEMPSEAFITVAELREVITQWVVGDVIPPPPVRWSEVPDVRWF